MLCSDFVHTALAVVSRGQTAFSLLGWVGEIFPYPTQKEKKPSGQVRLLW